MLSRSLGERGAITAEMMMTLPVLMMVFAVMMVGLQTGLVQYKLQHDVSDDARLASLGAPVANARVEGDFLCVTREAHLRGGMWALSPHTLSASACALNPAGWSPSVDGEY